MASIASSVNSSVTPSVSISATYCLISEASVSVRMRRKSSRVSALSSTRIGSRPCSSGNRSDGFDRWNAPEAMNRMWSVLTEPCLVETVVPSISGSRSRCTPSRDTSPPTRPSRAGDLVDLIEEHDAVLLDRLDRLLHQLVLVEQLVGFLGRPGSRANSATVTRRVLVRPPPSLPKMSPMLMAPICAPGMPGISNIGMPAARGLHLDLDFLVVELAGAQLLAERILGRGAGARRRPARRRHAPRRPARREP